MRISDWSSDVCSSDLKDGMDHATVRRKYQLVKAHDRVGRMADTWEYSQVALPRRRFSEALLGELRDQVPGLLEETPDTIVLRHVYIERRMTPLNLYLMRCSDQALDVAIQRYGDAIRELAAANIFPGTCCSRILASPAWAASSSTITDRKSTRR